MSLLEGQRIGMPINVVGPLLPVLAPGVSLLIAQGALWVLFLLGFPRAEKESAKEHAAGMRERMISSKGPPSLQQL